MAQQNRTTIKSYFETNDVPTEAQYIDAWDSCIFFNGDFLDEDNMASDSATKVASQQSIKAYADGIDNRVKVQAFILACSDLTSDLEVTTTAAYFRMPYGFTLTAVRASVIEAPTGSGITVDISENGVSILSTLITIDAGQKTSTTAATPPVISDTSLADDAEIIVGITGIGSTNPGKGLNVELIGYKS